MAFVVGLFIVGLGLPQRDHGFLSSLFGLVESYTG